jgi:lactam utilization protein B
MSSPSLPRIEINIDCGESFGHWSCGPSDELLMPMIDVANVACGGHAGDPVIMRRTIAAAKKHGIKVGARESKKEDQSDLVDEEEELIMVHCLMASL